MRRKVGHKTGVARYHQLYTLLRGALDDGTLAAGAALPSETALARRYSVSRNTVRRALARLGEEQRVVSVRGSGTYVRAAADPAVTTEAIAVALAQAGRAAHETLARWLRFQRTPTPKHILKRWPDFEPRALVLERRRFYREECFALVSSYVPEGRARGLTRVHIGHRTVVEALAELGVRAASGERAACASAADAEVARQLGLPVGAPVLVVETLVRDERLHPIEYQRALLRPDRFRLSLPLAYSAGDEGPVCQSAAGLQVISCG